MRFQNNQVLRHSPRCGSSALIHELAFYKQADFNLYVLRDDLLNPPFSGSKHRKYQGLFEDIIKHGIHEVIIPASLASNHLITTVHLCKKHNLKPRVFTKKPFGNLRPNAKATLDLLSEDEIFVDNDYHQKAHEYLKDHASSFLMPLGGYHPKAAASSLSLGYEIFDFHQKTPLDHVILDAGTGLQAAACLLALEEKGYQGKAHIICMGALDFDQVLKQIACWTDKKLPNFSVNVIRPFIAKSYASSNKTLDEFKNVFFTNNGIRLDTTYNAKSFYTLIQMYQKRQVQGTCLIVHSGGIYAG
jgi:1-aminocyclopropane-1-carboxylate deaminase